MDNRAIRPITELHPWSDNPRFMTDAGYQRLKKQIIGLGYYKPNLIMADGTILGGNMRFNIYEEIANSSSDSIHDYVLEVFNAEITPEQCQAIIDKYKNLWVSTIDFTQTVKGTWQAVVNGQVEFKEFPNKEDGMLEYALSDNDHGGSTDTEKLANMMPQFNIDWTDYTIPMYEPVTIASYFSEEQTNKNENNELTPEGVAKDLNITCPKCSFQFKSNEQLEKSHESTE